jgi:hypothetical protein
MNETTIASRRTGARMSRSQLLWQLSNRNSDHRSMTKDKKEKRKYEQTITTISVARQSILVNSNEEKLIINIPRPLSSTIFKSKSRLPLIFFRSNISRFRSKTRIPLPTKGIFSGWVPWCMRKLTDDSISYLMLLESPM